MNVPVLGQHDRRWAGIRLGTMDGATIGGYGCLATCLTMANAAFGGGEGLVDSIDAIFTNGGGYVDGRGHRSPQPGCDMVDWARIQGLLPNLAHVGAGYYPDGTRADLDRIRDWLAGGGLVVLQVFWRGNKSLMHFVLAVEYNGGDIIVHDPETGARQPFSSKLFGDGHAADDIYVAHFFADAIPPEPVNHPLPQASVPSPSEVTPKEEEVTQVEHDAAVAALKAEYEARLAIAAGEAKAAQEIVVKQSGTITQLTEALNAATPEWERTYNPNVGRAEVLTSRHTVVVDFSDHYEPVELEANTILDVTGEFMIGADKYYRTTKSTEGEPPYFYGVKAEDVTVYRVLPDPSTTPALDAAAKTRALSTSQQLHAAAANTVGGWRAIINKLTGSKK